MRLFVIGVGPLPFYRTPSPQNSLSEGTWQMVQPLLEEGHEIRLITLESGQHDKVQLEYSRLPQDISERFEHQYYPEPLRDNSPAIARRVQIALAAFKPDAVISAGSMIAAWVTTQLKHRLPLWYDIKGAFVPELQLRMQAPDAEDVFETFAIYKKMLIRGDRFSAVTENQAHMLMGELGMVGRLNPLSLDERFVTVKPSGLPPNSPRRLERTGRIRGRLCEPDSLVLFSSGGFNTWQDTRTFFETIEAVLEAEPKARFVCIGGGIGGHFDQGYESFRNWVDGSPHRNRYFLEGWVPQEQVVEYESEADIGINCDLDIPESRYGDRSRFLSWMARRVAVATTPVSQPSRMLVDKGMAIGLPVGSPREAAQAILNVARDRNALNRMTEKAEEFVRTEWSYKQTTRYLREWAARPTLARDNRFWFEEGKMSFQREIASLELVLDHMYTSDERKKARRPWKRVERILRQRWPWPDGGRWKL